MLTLGDLKISRERGRLDVMGFLEQVRTVVRTNRVFLRIGPAARGLGVTVVPDDGPPTHAWELAPGSTLWDCRNKSALACEAQILSKQYENDGSWGEWFARSPQQHTSAGPCGALYRRGVKKDLRTHSPQGAWA